MSINLKKWIPKSRLLRLKEIEDNLKTIGDYMEQDDKETINKINKSIIHATTPESELRGVVFRILDIDNDGDIDLTDWKYIVKFITKWIAVIVAIIFALKEGGTINIYSISGWTTILGIVFNTAYQKYSKKKNAEGFMKIIYTSRDLLLKFIDLINIIKNKTEEQSIDNIIKDFLITVKDTVARDAIAELEKKE